MVRQRKLLILLLMLLAIPLTVFLVQKTQEIRKRAEGTDSVTAGTMNLTTTFNSIGIELPFSGDDNGNATVTLEFKKASETEWRKGLDLWRTEGTTDLLAQGPSQDGQVAGIVTEAHAQGNVLEVGPSSTYATINAAIATASVGTTIKIHGGTYPEQVEVNKQVTLEPFGDGAVWVDAACAKTNSIHITASNVVVKGFGVKKSIDAGILIEGLSTNNVTVENMTLQDFDCQNTGSQYKAGISAYYAGSGHKLLNNTIVRRVELEGGGLTGGKSNGIWFKSSSEKPSGGGHLISGNTVKGGYDGIGGEVEDDPRGGYDQDTTIENNTIDTCFDDGIQVEGGTKNVRIRHNTIQRCGIGIAAAPNLTGPLYIAYNRITDGVPGFYNTVACFKMGDQGTGTSYYTGNTCILSGGADGWKQTNSGMNAIVARNNKIHVSRYIIEITDWTNAEAGSNTSFDQDCLYTTDATRFVKWAGTAYGSLSSWRSATGQEPNGLLSQTCPDPVEPGVGASPTPTPSPSPTPTPTPDPSSSPTPTPTPAPAPASLTGAFYGSALLLDAGTAYQIRVTVHDPDNTGGDSVVEKDITTRADNIPDILTLTPTHFVRADGDDAKDGTTEATAWKTLNKAIRSAPSGAVVEVGPGFYKGPIQAPSALRDNKITFKAQNPAINDNREVINAGSHSVIEPDAVAEKGTGTWTQITLVGPGNNGAQPGVNYKVWKWANAGVTGPIIELGIAPDHKDIPQRVAAWDTDAVNLDTPEEWAELMYSNKTYNYGLWRAPGTSDIYMRIYDPANQNHRDPNNTGLNPNNFWVTVGAGATTSAGIYLGGAESRISGFEVRQFRNGISIKGNTSIVDHNIISGNAVAVYVTGTEDVVIEKNYVLDSNLWTDDPANKLPISWKFIKQKITTAGDSIYPTDAIGNTGAQTDAFPGHGVQNKRLVMRYNTIDGTFNGTKGSGDYGRYVAIDFDVYNNLIKHIADDAIEPDGSAINYRVWNNRFENIKTCLSEAPVQYGPIYLFRNEFSQVGTSTGTDGTPAGNCFKYSDTQSIGGRISEGGRLFARPAIYVVNNTFWTNIADVHGGTSAAGDGLQPPHFYMRNNIFRMTKLAFSVDESAVVSTPNFIFDGHYNNWDEDYNFFATASPNIHTGLRYIRTPDYTTNVPAYRTATGGGTHTNLLGNFKEPSVIDNALNNPASGNLTLKADSPFIDAGVAVPNISDRCGIDFRGSAPDLGATEGTSSAPCPSGSSPTPTPSPTPGASSTPTPLLTATPTPSPTLTPTVTPSITITPSSTPTTTPIITPTATPSGQPTATPTSIQPSPTPTGVSQLIGDFNGNREVDIIDYAIFFDNFGKKPPPNPATDLNGNGEVDIIDYAIFFDHFGEKL